MASTPNIVPSRNSSRMQKFSFVAAIAYSYARVASASLSALRIPRLPIWSAAFRITGYCMPESAFFNSS